MSTIDNDDGTFSVAYDAVHAMADKAAAESAVGVAAAFDEGLRYPERPKWRIAWLGLRLHFWPGSDFRRAELMGRIASYASPKSEAT